MSQQRLAACLATSIAIVAVTLHGCGQGQDQGTAQKAADNETAADMNNTNEVSTPAPAPNTTAPATTGKETPAPTTAPKTPAPATTGKKDATTPAATKAPTTKVVTTTTTELTRKFETMEKGTCCCSTATKIENKADCLSALAELKETGTKELQHEHKVGWEGTEANIPGACSIKVWEDGTWHGHWNENRNGKAREDMIPVCKKADGERLRLFDDAIQGDGPSSSSMAVGVVACLSMGVLMAGVGLMVMRRGATSPVNRREVSGLIIGDDTEPEEA